METVAIKKIRKVKCHKKPVYDITVPKYSNFILGNGLVVHNCKPYQYLKSTIYEKRFEMYKSDRLFDEFIDIERNLNTGKIDHTPNGHKDALDAVCGATFNASKFAEEFAFDYGETLDTVLSVNTNVDMSTKEQLTVEFEKELQQQFAPRYIKNQQEQTQNELSNNTQENNAKFNDEKKEKPAYLDFGMGPSQIYKPQYFSQGIVYW